MVVALSLLFDGIDRKVRARMQARVGPPILQPLYDLVKLFAKARVIPITAAGALFTAAPLASLACAVSSGALVLASAVWGLGLPGDLIEVFVLLTASSVIALLGGAASGNPYAAISLSRGLSLIASYKSPMVVAALTVASRSAFSLAQAIKLQQARGAPLAASVSGMLAFIAYALCLLPEGEVTPFDIPLAPTELAYGYAVEYGGPYLALIKVSKSVSRFTAALVAAFLFAYVPAVQPLPSLLGLLVTFALAAATFTVPHTFLARLRVGQASSFCWKLPMLLALSSLATSLAGW